MLRYANREMRTLTLTLRADMIEFVNGGSPNAVSTESASPEDCARIDFAEYTREPLEASQRTRTPNERGECQSPTLSKLSRLGKSDRLPTPGFRRETSRRDASADLELVNRALAERVRAPERLLQRWGGIFRVVLLDSDRIPLI
jgi:hypothetical protein